MFRLVTYSSTVRPIKNRCCSKLCCIHFHKKCLFFTVLMYEGELARVGSASAAGQWWKLGGMLHFLSVCAQMISPATQDGRGSVLPVQNIWFWFGSARRGWKDEWVFVTQTVCRVDDGREFLSDASSCFVGAVCGGKAGWVRWWWWWEVLPTWRRNLELLFLSLYYR